MFCRPSEAGSNVTQADVDAASQLMLNAKPYLFYIPKYTWRVPLETSYVDEDVIFISHSLPIIVERYALNKYKIGNVPLNIRDITYRYGIRKGFYINKQDFHDRFLSVVADVGYSTLSKEDLLVGDYYLSSTNTVQRTNTDRKLTGLEWKIVPHPILRNDCITLVRRLKANQDGKMIQTFNGLAFRRM